MAAAERSPALKSGDLLRLGGHTAVLIQVHQTSREHEQ